MKTRNTIQKKLIMESLNHLSHPTAEEVWLDISKSIPNVSRTTVYRNLNKLVDENKLVSLTLDQGGAHFDCNTQAHNHFYCRVCNKLYDLPHRDLDLSHFQDQLEGCAVEESEVLLKGVCQACQDKAEDLLGKESKA